MIRIFFARKQTSLLIQYKPWPCSTIDPIIDIFYIKILKDGITN